MPRSHPKNALYLLATALVCERSSVESDLIGLKMNIVVCDMVGRKDMQCIIDEGTTRGRDYSLMDKVVGAMGTPVLKPASPPTKHDPATEQPHAPQPDAGPAGSAASKSDVRVPGGV